MVFKKKSLTCKSTPKRKPLRKKALAIKLWSFTLIELLTLIAIIGILAGILIPTIGIFKEQGRRALCLNNLRQHGIAWQLYLSDHDNCFPPLGDNSRSGEANISIFGGKIGIAERFHPENGASYRVLNKYLDIKDESSVGLEIFHCPNDKEKVINLVPSYTNFDYYGTSYLGNYYIFAFQPDVKNHLLPSAGDGEVYPRPLGTITYPKNMVYLEECMPTNKPGHGGAGGGPTYNAPVMVLFVDGHVGGPFMSYDNFDFLNLYPNTNKKVLLLPNNRYPH